MTSVGEAALSAPRPDSTEAGRRGVYLHPGQVFASAEATSVTTILGSCVAVCLFDRRRGLGAISHFVLPGVGGGDTSARFADVALRELVSRVLALGGDRTALEAKVFGGASVLDGGGGRRPRLGDENVRRALSFLEEEGVRVAARDTGGTRGRKVIFHTDTGTAWVKHL